MCRSSITPTPHLRPHAGPTQPAPLMVLGLWSRHLSAVMSDYYHLRCVHRCDHSASLHKVSLALINIHTCSGHFSFPGNRGGDRVAGAFLPSCLMEGGNLRLIPQRANSTLNLDGHGLMRLAL